MKPVRSPKFKHDYDQLPAEIQEATKEKFRLFKQDMFHPSLRIKKMKGFDDIWEGHVTMGYVFTFERKTDESGEEIVIFRRIGTHDIYKNP